MYKTALLPNMFFFFFFPINVLGTNQAGFQSSNFLLPLNFPIQSTSLFHSTSQFPQRWPPLHLLSTRCQVLLTWRPWAWVIPTPSNSQPLFPHSHANRWKFWKHTFDWIDRILLVAHSYLLTSRWSQEPCFAKLSYSFFLPSAQYSSPRCSHLHHLAPVNSSTGKFHCLSFPLPCPPCEILTLRNQFYFHLLNEVFYDTLNRSALFYWLLVLGQTLHLSPSTIILVTWE